MARTSNRPKMHTKVPEDRRADSLKFSERAGNGFLNPNPNLRFISALRSISTSLYRVAQKKKKRNGIPPTICGCNNWYQCMCMR